MKSIRHTECIEKLNPMHLKKISEHYDLVLIPFSSQTARKRVTEIFEKPNFIDECLENLSPHHKSVLTLIDFFAKDTTSDSINIIIKKLFGKEKDHLPIINDLLTTGMVFHVKNKLTNETYYLIPNEISKQIKQHCSDSLKSLYKKCPHESFKIHRADNCLFLSVLTILTTGAKQELKLNINCLLNRRTITKIKPFIGIEKDSVNYSTLEMFINELFQCLIFFNMITIKNDTESAIKNDNIEQWLCLSFQDKIASLYNFIFHENNKDSDLSRFAKYLRLLPNDKFMDISQLKDLYQSFFNIAPEKMASFEKKPFHHYPIFILYLFGIIEFGSEDIHQFCSWKITEHGHNLISGQHVEHTLYAEDNELVIQPNFELIISRHANLGLLWKIHKFADVLQCEYRIRFTISHNSVYRGLSNGITEEEIGSILNAKNNISQNVIYSLKEWCKDYGAVYFADVFVLRCKDKHLADQIRLHPKIKDYVKGSFSKTDLVVDRSNFDELIEILKTINLMPLKKIITFDTEKKNRHTTKLHITCNKQKTTLKLDNLSFLF